MAVKAVEAQSITARRAALGPVALEWVFFVLALCFVLWLAHDVKRHAQDGELRWQKDSQAAASGLSTAMPMSLIDVWCQREGAFVRKIMSPDTPGLCRWSPASAFKSDVPSPEATHARLQVWQQEIASRAQQWRQRWTAEDALQMRAAMTAEAMNATDEWPAQGMDAAAGVLLEPQVPSEVSRLQAQSNNRLVQWDQWVKERVAPLTQSPVAEVQADALWWVARALEGVGTDVGARTVRQSIRAQDQAKRADYLQNIVQQLPWLLLGHCLLTVLATHWMRSRAAPLHQFNGLLVLGMASWLGAFALGAAPSPVAYPPLLIALGVWMVVSWVVVHFFSRTAAPPPTYKPINASWIPGWWLFTATGWLLLLDQSLHFHDRLRFLALEQWWAWAVSAVLLPLAAWASPWLLLAVQRLAHFLWGRHSRAKMVMRGLLGVVGVLVFFLAHRLNIPQYVTGEVLKLVFLVSLCGWCVWKMPFAAQLWHAGHARATLRDLSGAMVLMVLVAAAAFITSDKGPLLVMAMVLAVLLATVMGWTGGMALLMLGFGAIFLVGVDLDVVGERLEAWRDPFSAARDDMARLMWFQSEAARFDWGFGVGQVPWCGTSRLQACHGLPLQLQSDYTFTAIMGWWGPWGAWLWLLLFSLYAYRALVHCATVSPQVLTPLQLLQPAAVKEVFSIHLLFLFAVLVLMQTWITVAGNLSWLPLTGVTWPLMSYGKSSLWISTVFVGAWGLRRAHA